MSMTPLLKLIHPPAAPLVVILALAPVPIVSTPSRLHPRTLLFIAFRSQPFKTTWTTPMTSAGSNSPLDRLPASSPRSGPSEESLCKQSNWRWAFPDFVDIVTKSHLNEDMIPPFRSFFLHNFHSFGFLISLIRNRSFVLGLPSFQISQLYALSNGIY